MPEVVKKPLTSILKMLAICILYIRLNSISAYNIISFNIFCPEVRECLIYRKLKTQIYEDCFFQYKIL